MTPCPPFPRLAPITGPSHSQALHACVLRQNKPDALEALLQAKADPNELSDDNSNALHVCVRDRSRCAQSETTAMAMTLLNAKVDPIAQNNDWESPLTLALRGHTCSKELAATLRAAMAKARASRTYAGPGDDELWGAAAKGDLARVQLLLGQAVDPNEPDAKKKDGPFVSKYKTFPLHYATAYGHLDIVEVLLRGKADPVIGALSLALKHDHADCAKALLRGKADPNEGFGTEAKGDPSHDSGKARPADRFHNSVLIGSPLFHTLRGGKIDVAMALLHAKADNNVWSFDGTPLHWAVTNGKPDVIKAILQTKADPDLEGSYEMHFYAPLHYAAGYGHADCVKVLLQGKADPTKGLQAAAAGGYAGIAKTLLQGKANPNAVASFAQFGPKTAAWSPLQRASAYCKVDCARVLLEGQADPNATDEEGKTALDVICTGEANWSMFRELVAGVVYSEL